MAATAVARRRSPLGPELRERLAGFFEASPAVVPALVAVAVFIWFAADEGGFEPSTWLIAAVLLVGVLLIALTALPRPQPSRPALLFIALFAGYAAFSYLSIGWADQQGAAWDGANRTVLYAVVVALFALWPLRGDAAAVVAGAFGLGVAVVGLVELLRVGSAETFVQFFNEGRLSEPTGYANANVALWFTALWPCLLLGVRREVHPLLRGALLAAAGLLGCLAVLGQSRGWVYILPLVLLLAVVVVPGRGRTIAGLAAVGVGLLAVLGPLLEVYDSFKPGEPPGEAWSSAVRATLLLALVLGVAGAAAGYLDRRITLPRASSRRVELGVVAALVLVCLGGFVAYSATRGSPFSAVADRWEEFKKPGSEPAFDGNRFASAASTYRYDYWRVVWREFERAPLAGIGVDNFRADYLREGLSRETPLYPHSTQLRPLSQTGLIGGLLFYGALAAACLAALPALRRRDLAGAAAGAGVMAFAYWFAHGALDWLWEFPGLAAPALALLALAGGAAAARPRDEAPLLSGRLPLAAAGAAAFALSLSFLLPWLAARDLQEARASAARNAPAALDRLERAADLNPLSPVALQTAGVIDAERGELGDAERHLRRALARDPDDSFTNLQLGAVASAQGRGAEALAYAERARALSPRDRPTATVLDRLLAGKRLDPAELNSIIRDDIDARIGPG